MAQNFRLNPSKQPFPRPPRVLQPVAQFPFWENSRSYQEISKYKTPCSSNWQNERDSVCIWDEASTAGYFEEVSKYVRVILHNLPCNMNLPCNKSEQESILSSTTNSDWQLSGLPCRERSLWTLLPESLLIRDTRNCDPLSTICICYHWATVL